MFSSNVRKESITDSHSDKRFHRGCITVMLLFLGSFFLIEVVNYSLGVRSAFNDSRPSRAKWFDEEAARRARYRKSWAPVVVNAWIHMGMTEGELRDVLGEPESNTSVKGGEQIIYWNCGDNMWIRVGLRDGKLFSKTTESR